jgi:hypothetical protein
MRFWQVDGRATIDFVCQCAREKVWAVQVSGISTLPDCLAPPHRSRFTAIRYADLSRIGFGLTLSGTE